MNINDVVTIIQAVGFPIVMCGAMAYYVKYITDKNRDMINNLMDTHRTEMTEITTAVNNNTIALQKLSDMMEIK